MDKETVYIIAALLGSNVLSNGAQSYIKKPPPPVAEAVAKQDFAQEQLSICLANLEQCHKDCGR